jgi:Xaa-Pro aminopeptidase
MSSFADRRAEFAAAIGDGIAVIPAGVEQVRNDDVHHEFRQDSAFHFLTGFHEPDAVALLDPSHPTERYVLFVRPRDREMEIWNGYRAGVDGAIERYGADAAFPVGELGDELRRRLIGRSRVLVAPGRAGAAVSTALEALGSLRERLGRVVPSEVVDPGPLLDELRLRKHDDEVGALRRACDISVEGHAEAMRFARPGLTESQVQAAMEYVFRQRGSVRNGYPSIVAGGPNACILHYVENDAVLADGSLLLIDAGAEHGHHSADITRTFPVGGTFTAEQRAVYEVVLAAERAAFGHAGPGGSMAAMHETATRVLTEGLVDLGLLPLGVEDSLAMHHYREYFMHGTGHWLGMDVHDAGRYRVDGVPLALEPGMAFTVEPGIYVAPDRESFDLALHRYDATERLERRLLLGTAKAKELEAEEEAEADRLTFEVPEAFRGIGVRIEDDVLVTGNGWENLTAALPVDPDEVEALCAEAPLLPVL